MRTMWLWIICCCLCCPHTSTFAVFHQPQLKLMAGLTPHFHMWTFSDWEHFPCQPPLFQRPANLLILLFLFGCHCALETSQTDKVLSFPKAFINSTFSVCPRFSATFISTHTPGCVGEGACKLLYNPNCNPKVQSQPVLAQLNHSYCSYSLFFTPSLTFLPSPSNWHYWIC